MKRFLSILALMFPLLLNAATYPNYFVTNASPFDVVPGVSVYVPTVYTTNLLTTNMSVTDFLFIGTAQVNYLTMLGAIFQQGLAYTNNFLADTNYFAGAIGAGNISSTGTIFGTFVGTNLSGFGVAASNVVSGGVLPIGTVSTTAMNTNTVLVANSSAGTRDWSGNPQITNLTALGTVTASGTVTGSGLSAGIGSIRVGQASQLFWTGKSALTAPQIGWLDLVGPNATEFVGMIFGTSDTAGQGTTTLRSTNWPAFYVSKATNTPVLTLQAGTNPAGIANLAITGFISPTNGVFLQPLSTNQSFTVTSGRGVYCVNGTNQLITLPDASVNPWVIVRFVSTNGNGNFTLTNATGSQTIRNGADLSLKNIGVGEVGIFSDGANWQLASKVRTVWPNAQFSCTTNIPLVSANTAYPIPYNATDFNNSQGIALGVATNSIYGTTKIWITNSGIYEFGPSIVESFSGNETVRFWFRQDDTNVPNSCTPCFSSAGRTNVVTVPFIVSVTGPTAIEIWAESNNTGNALAAQAAAGNFPAAPSVICPVKRISDSRP